MSEQPAPVPNRLAVVVLGLLISAASSASQGAWLACQDNRLAAMNAAEVMERLQAAGGQDCRMHESDWGESVSCERNAGQTVFGLAVRELSSEIADSGRRTLMVVTPASLARTRAALAGQAAAPGLDRVVEARDDGTTSIRCIAEAGAYATGQTQSGITGVTPPLPAGARGWEVCAQPARGRPTCASADGQGQYRIAGLPPGEYGLIATPVGADDRQLRALLTRRQIGETSAGGPKMLAERVSVREGAMALAGPLTLLRLPTES